MRKFGVSGLGFRVSGFRFWGASLGECANIPGERGGNGTSIGIGV